MKFVVAYAATAFVFLALDILWLTTIALKFYREQLGPMLLDKPSLPIAAAFYLIYVGAIVALAVLPALNGGTWVNALVAGAILGVAAYGTYDITNLATLKGWPVILSATDLAWGTALTAVSATFGYAVTLWLKV
jgi:uncharacterized membrane protein